MSNKALNSFRESVKLLLGILAAIALTNAVGTFIAIHKQAVITTPFPKDGATWAALVIFLLIAVRYFIGNIQHLNSDIDNDQTEVAIDSVAAIIESLLICYAGSFIATPSILYQIICFLMVFDLMWYLLSYTILLARRKKSDISFAVHVNQTIHLATLLALALLAIEVNDGKPFLSAFLKGQIEINAFVAALIFSFNAIVDLLVNSPRYFGADWVWSIRTSAEQDVPK